MAIDELPKLTIFFVLPIIVLVLLVSMIGQIRSDQSPTNNSYTFAQTYNLTFIPYNCSGHPTLTTIPKSDQIDDANGYVLNERFISIINGTQVVYRNATVLGYKNFTWNLTRLATKAPEVCYLADACLECTADAAGSMFGNVSNTSADEEEWNVTFQYNYYLPSGTWNTSNLGEKGILNMSRQFPLIGLILIFVVVIGVVVSAFWLMAPKNN